MVFYFNRSQLSKKCWFILWWIHNELIVEDNLGEPLCWVISAFGALISLYLTHIVARLEIMFNACMDFVNPFQRNLEIYCPRVASGLASNCLILSYRTFPYSSNPSNLEYIENDLWPTSAYAGLGLAIHVPTLTGRPGCLGKITPQDISQ